MSRSPLLAFFLVAPSVLGLVPARAEPTGSRLVGSLGSSDRSRPDLPSGPGSNWIDHFDTYSLGDNFDSYLTGSQIHGQGGWKGWDNDPAFGALTSAAQAHSAPNSVDILGTSDLVHEYTGLTAGTWHYSAWQYIPSTFSGTTYFVMLNTYADGGPYNWSVQVNFDSATGLVSNDGTSGGTLPLVLDQWVELRVEIDLFFNTQSFFYDGTLLYTGTWTEEVSAGGALNIGAVDLFANGSDSVFYDDIWFLQQLHHTAGWEGWSNDPAHGALVSTTQDRSAPHSVEIVGASNLTHLQFGYTAETWTFTAWQYIPSTLSGVTHFNMMNTYSNDAFCTFCNWSVQVHFDSASGLISNDGASGGTMPYVTDQWAEIRVVIDLDTNVQTFYYNGAMLYTGTWTEEVSGGGALNFATVSLNATGASPVYYDDVSLSNLPFLDGFESGDTNEWHVTVP